ncbi:hypothetical protein [Rubellicoccus peritrichatus]|uniref:FHA domain-containing protein n=1 Tax=Rubellicoccus peritrichatus TaxID=3080537 RepID=A0AAQ3QQS9_9BACT|nr:hypothetical protein [Puniceicoccus sp. CR14]WOO40583.1 hypothetical protein RZN69_18330 [Puniceicoccus sp. CR14]
MSEEQFTNSTTIEPGLKVTIQGTTYIARDGDVLGREGTVATEELGSINTVSRRHAVVSKREGFWFITIPKSVNNSTKLDGMEVERDAPQKINGTRILKMSESCVVTLSPG